MKKLGLAIAVASALGAATSVVNAYDVGEFQEGLLVPFASFQAATEGTSVGLVSACPGNVYWVFADVDSHHITDGVFPMTKNDMYSFVLANEAGLGLEGKQGYLVFTFDRDDGTTNHPDGQINSFDGNCLAGNAFYVDAANQDVAFVPTAPLDDSDFGHGTGIGPTPGPRFLTNDSITALGAGAQLGSYVYSRYFIDNAPGGNDTALVMWTVCKPPSVNTAIMYDDDQDSKSINFLLPEDELNVVDPETIEGREADHLDGFIVWQVQSATNASGGSAYCDHDGSATTNALVDDQAALSYSIITSDLFGAAQTLYNPHTDPAP